jgi:hypothetical protein
MFSGSMNILLHCINYLSKIILIKIISIDVILLYYKLIQKEKKLQNNFRLLIFKIDNYDLELV